MDLAGRKRNWQDIFSVLTVIPGSSNRSVSAVFFFGHPFIRLPPAKLPYFRVVGANCARYRSGMRMPEDYVAMLLNFKTAVAVSLLAFSGLASSEMNAQSAFAAGKSAGADNIDGIIGLISLVKAGESMKDFSASPPPQSSYWAGQGTVLNTLVGGGDSRVSECASTGLSSTDPKEKQHCEAVNAIQDVHANKPTNIISSTDSLIVKGKLITSDPEAIAGIMNSTYSGCTTTTLTTPGATVEQTCNDYGELETQTCATGTLVTLDPDYFYKCLETIATPNNSTCTFGRSLVVDRDVNYQCTNTKQKITTETCDKVAVISVTGSTGTSGGCTPGTLLASGTMIPSYWYCGNGYANGTNYYNVYVYCSGPSNVRVRLVGGNYSGVKDYSAYPSAPSGSATFPPQGYWTCTPGTAQLSTYTFTTSVGCNATTCTVNVNNNANPPIKISLQIPTPVPTIINTLSKSMTWQNGCSSQEARAQ